MSHLVNAASELDAARQLYLLLLSSPAQKNVRECISVLSTIQYSDEGYRDYVSFLDTYREIGGDPVRRGWAKAQRVYEDPKDRHVKPSYLSRLTAYPDKTRRDKFHVELNQLEKIAFEILDKPGLNCLSFVFLRPADLFDKIRPGYVPCPIAGDFKVRNGKLILNVMFRTCDFYTVGFFDMYFLRRIQMHVVELVKRNDLSGKLDELCCGEMSLFFSRIFVEKTCVSAVKAMLVHFK